MIEVLFRRNVLIAVGVGIGVAVFAPVVIPALVRVGRPVIKGAIKVGVLAYQQSRETLAVVGEAVEDLVAEVQADLYDERLAGTNQEPPAEAQPPSPQPQ